MVHLTSGGSRLWLGADLRAAIAADASGRGPGRLPRWALAASLELGAKLDDEAFPCTFAVAAARKGEIRYAFATPGSCREEQDDARAALVAFTDHVRDLDRVRASLLPCALLLPPLAAGTSLKRHFDRGWALLQALHDRDEAAWPAHVPTDPAHPRWSFCFGGVPLFVTFKTPAHVARRSRRLHGARLILFQAREGFDTLAGNDSKGRSVRRIIREKLAAYDGLPPWSRLGHYGSGGNLEWEQYFAPDDSRPQAARCPFRHSQ